MPQTLLIEEMRIVDSLEIAISMLLISMCVPRTYPKNFGVLSKNESALEVAQCIKPQKPGSGKQFLKDKKKLFLKKFLLVFESLQKIDDFYAQFYIIAFFITVGVQKQKKICLPQMWGSSDSDGGDNGGETNG